MVKTKLKLKQTLSVRSLKLTSKLIYSDKLMSANKVQWNRKRKWDCLTTKVKLSEWKVKLSECDTEAPTCYWYAWRSETVDSSTSEENAV